MNDSTISQPFFLIRWLSDFKYSIIRSLTDLNYYVEVLNFPVRSSFKVLAWFYVFLGILLSLYFVLIDLPEFQQSVNTIRSEAMAGYPDDLVFDWNGTELSSTLQQPLEIPFPPVTQQDSFPKNLLIIDTTTDQFPNKLNTLFFVNRNKSYFNTLQGEWAESDLSHVIEVDSAHLDKQAFLQIAEASKKTQKEITILLPWIVFFINSFGLLFVRLITILINAVILQIFFQFLNKPISYKKVFQLCLHMLIPTELIHQFSALAFPSLAFPMFGLAFWIIATLVLWHLRHLRIVNFQLQTKSKND